MQRNDLRSQAFVDDINAKMEESSAQSALAAGQHQVQSILLHGDQVKDAQTVAQASNGIDLGSGSAVAVRATTDIMKTIDANTANANAVRSAFGYRTQGANYAGDAAAKRAGADAINPGMAAFSSLLTSAGNVAGSWYSLSKDGAIGDANDSISSWWSKFRSGGQSWGSTSRNG
jgi:hypothetical protein